MKKLTTNDYGLISETLTQGGLITYQHKQQTQTFVLRDKQRKALGVIDINVFDYFMFDTFEIDSVSKTTNALYFCQYNKTNACYIDTLNKTTLRAFLML